MRKALLAIVLAGSLIGLLRQWASAGDLAGPDLETALRELKARNLALTPSGNLSLTSYIQTPLGDAVCVRNSSVLFRYPTLLLLPPRASRAMRAP